METLVRYIGITNDYTFNQNIEENSIGCVQKLIKLNGDVFCEVEFENGIITTIDIDDLELESKKE